MRTLTDASRRWHLHQPWREHVRVRLDGVDMFLLTAVVRPAGYLPDFLVPSPARRHVAFATALTDVASTHPAQVAAELTHLASCANWRPSRPTRCRG